MKGINTRKKQKNRQISKRSIKFKSLFKNTIYDVLKDRGFEETTEDDWSLFWVNKKFMYNTFNTIHFEQHQRVNHFRTFYELTRKDLLIKNLKKKKRQLQHEGRKEEAMEYDKICPVSFILPHEYYLFENYFNNHSMNGKNIFIMKPTALSQGKGIYLINSLSQVADFKRDRTFYTGPPNQKITPYLVQSYVADPLLVGLKKFDLRLYVLVTSYNPLTVYIYREGFCRFSQQKYSSSSKDMLNKFIHLTNVAVQKKSEDYDHKGCKWGIGMFRNYLTTKYGKKKTDECFDSMQNIILLSLNAVKSVMINSPNCFELYGFDILIDKSLKPWILEINASPSLTSSTSEDYMLKYYMLNDLLDVIDFEQQFTETKKKKLIKNFIGFDLVFVEKTFLCNTSKLGSAIERQLLGRRLLKNVG